MKRRIKTIGREVASKKVGYWTVMGTVISELWKQRKSTIGFLTMLPMAFMMSPMFFDSPTWEDDYEEAYGKDKK